MEDDAKLSIYRASRTIRRKDNSLYNALMSIYDDSVFVGEISQLWPDLPLLANLRCGLWYSSKFHSTCYFKSTDGHTNNLSFNTSRLNLHVAQLAGQKGGCFIVDSTRRGKRFPDSMSKTIPIWTCVLNRSIRNHFRKINYVSVSNDVDEREVVSADWDCSLHLPLWVSETEKASIERRLEEWTEQLDESGADIASIASCLKKPLRPLWISQRSVIWLNEVPDHDSWDFTPVILVNASSSTGLTQIRTSSEHSWNYISGAGDDEESWSRGLSPSLFWSHVYDLVSSGPDLCNRKVTEIVEKDRVYRAHRGQRAPQIIIKSSKSEASSVDRLGEESPMSLNISNSENDSSCYEQGRAISWIGETNLAVSTSQADLSNVDYILNCDKGSINVSLPDAEAYLHLPMLVNYERMTVFRHPNSIAFSLSNNLPSAVNFAKSALSKEKTLLICCDNGEDIGICVCLAILISLFSEKGTFDGGKFFGESQITKGDMRRRLIVICSYAVNARPSRGNLKQVFSFLSGVRAD